MSPQFRDHSTGDFVRVSTRQEDEELVEKAVSESLRGEEVLPVAGEPAVSNPSQPSLFEDRSLSPASPSIPNTETQEEAEVKKQVQRLQERTRQIGEKALEKAKLEDMQKPELSANADLGGGLGRLERGDPLLAGRLQAVKITIVKGRNGPVLKGELAGRVIKRPLPESDQLTEDTKADIAEALVRGEGRREPRKRR